MVAIRNLYETENDLITHFYAVKGEILDVSYDEYTFTIYEDCEMNGQIIYGVKGEFNDNVFNYFIHLSDWREKQIKGILDD